MNTISASRLNYLKSSLINEEKYTALPLKSPKIIQYHNTEGLYHKYESSIPAFTGSLLGMSQENLAWLSKEPINANMIFKKPELIDAFKGMEIAHMEVLSQDPELAQNVLYDIESIYAFKNLPAAKIPSVTNGHTIAEMAQGVVDFFKQADNALRFPIAGVNAWGDGGWKTQYGEPNTSSFS